MPLWRGPVAPPLRVPGASEGGLVGLVWLVLPITIISAGLGHPPTPLALPPSLTIGLSLLHLSTATVIYIILDLLLLLGYNYNYNSRREKKIKSLSIFFSLSHFLFYLSRQAGGSILISILPTQPRPAGHCLVSQWRKFHSLCECRGLSRTLVCLSLDLICILSHSGILAIRFFTPVGCLSFKDWPIPQLLASGMTRVALFLGYPVPCIALPLIFQGVYWATRFWIPF